MKRSHSTPYLIFAGTCLIVVGLLLTPVGITAEDRITPKEVKAKMDKGEDILIVDVRTPASYMGSKIKIKGALRIDPNEIERRYKELPMDKEIITYCT